jgi:hypothetical protein
MPPENSSFNALPVHIHTTSESATAMQPHVVFNSNQYGQNASGSANNFTPSVAAPIVLTSVPQNYNNNNRSVCFNSNLQQPSYQTVAYNTPPLLPKGTGVSYGLVPDSCFNGSPQQIMHTQISLPEMPSHTYVPPVPQISSRQPTDSFKNQLDNILREFGLEPKSRARAYQQPYPDYFDLTPYPRGFTIPNFDKFTGEHGKSTYEHIGQFLAQCSDIGTSDVYRLKLFPLSLSDTAFTWFTSLAPNSILTWAQLEKKFHDYFYSGETELRLSDLTMVRQQHNERVHDYIRRFQDVKNRCFSLNIAEKDLADLAFSGLLAHIKEKLEGQEFLDVNQVLQKALAHENQAKEIKKQSRLKENMNKEKENHMVKDLEYDGDSASGDYIDICIAEWVQAPTSKPFACSALNPTPTKREDIKYTFDVSKCDRIFDMLLQEKLIRVREGHVIPIPEELAGRDYCKWHNSFSHAINGCNVFRRQVQSAISDGRLTFIESAKMKLDTDPFPINVIDFTNKKMLIRSDQTESARGKNVVIDDNAPPRIIRPKNPKGGWKINKKKKQSAPIPKPTVKKLLDKYTLCKDNNVFSQFGGTKCSPCGPEGDEHRPGPSLHEERARFSWEARSHEAAVFRGSRSTVQTAYGRINKGDCKFAWVPIGRESHVVSRDGTEHGCTKSIAAADTRLHADLEPIVQTHSNKAMVPISTSQSGPSASLCARDSLKVGVGRTAVHGLEIGGHQSVDGSGSVQRRDVDREEKGLDHIRGASSCTSQKTESASMHTDPVMRSISSGKRFPPMGFKPSTSSSTQGGGSASRGSLKIKASNVYDQQRVFSAKQGISAPRTEVCQCRPRNSGGSRIKSVAPETKPRPQWCPTRLTPTQKRGLQRLRASEIRKEIAEKKNDEWLNKGRLMVSPKMIWIKKCIIADENINVDDMVTAGDSKNITDAPTDMDVDQGR